MPADDRSIAELLASLCDETISPAEMQRLDWLIRSDAEVRRQYLEYLDLHARLSCSFHRPAEPRDEGRGAWDEGHGMADSPALDVSKPTAAFPPLTTSHYPPTTNFVGGPVFSYMVSLVIVGMMLLGAWAYKITHYNQIAEAPPPAVPSSDRSELVFVGRISGMVDCRWADPQTEAYAGASVPLDRKYALASGLMEITYKTGAKVILEGPCSYEVESRRGGYLSLGKLTAKVETKGSGVRGQGSEKTNPKSPNPKSPDPWSLTPGPLFAVRTPTAIITDLGTEFGVEVSQGGNTTSHVFRGSVKVQVVASEKGTGPICRNGPEGASHKLDLSPFPTQGVVLRANESVRVEKGERADGPRLVLPEAVGDPPKFVRRLVEPPKQLDLLDVIAGGNGTGRRRERGLDPTTGMEDPLLALGERDGDRQFQPVTWHKLIDGVFVPDGGDGPVRIDSAGGAFDGFPKTAGSTWGSIWPRAAGVDPTFERKGWIYEICQCERFMPERRGMIGVCPNVGITFDLAAVREMYKDSRPVRLRTVAGLGDRADFESPFDGAIDLWVFVDGQVKLKRIGLRRRDGTVEIDVELAAAERFLTLAATDGGDGQAADWVIFGDPVLQMKPIEENP